jgi:hypothetical protein
MLNQHGHSTGLAIFLWSARDPLFATEKPGKSPAAIGRNRIKMAVFCGKTRSLFGPDRLFFGERFPAIRCVKTQKNRREAAGLVGFEAKQGPFLARE